MRYLAIVVVAVAVAAVGCGADGPTSLGQPMACARVGFPAIRVEVRRADGRPIAPGATLVVTDGKFRQTVTEAWSALTLDAAENRMGRYTIEVSKPYYKTVRVGRISVPGDACGAAAPVTVPVTLEALPIAPPIRSVSVAQAGVGLAAGLHNQYTVWVDAVAGTDTSVTWSLSDPRVATIDQNGFLTANCRTTDDILVIATSKQAPSVRGTGRLGVFGSACP
jgi:hypothetical protein